MTSHTYNQAKAEPVMNVIPEFLAEAEFLYEQLQQRSRWTRSFDGGSKPTRFFLLAPR